MRITEVAWDTDFTCEGEFVEDALGGHPPVKGENPELVALGEHGDVVFTPTVVGGVETSDEGDGMGVGDWGEDKVFVSPDDGGGGFARRVEARVPDVRVSMRVGRSEVD